MKRNLHASNLTTVVAFAVMSVFIATQSATAVPIAVVNASFEDPDIGGGVAVPVGWNVVNNAGVQQFGGGTNPQPTDGGQHAFVNGPGAGGGALHQTLTDIITDGAVLTLTVDIGQISNFNGSEGTVRLFGSNGGFTTPLSNANGTAEVAGIAPASGGPYQEVTVTYNALANGDPFAGQSIGIALEGSSGIQVLYDDVRFDITGGGGPAPAIPMLITGVTIEDFSSQLTQGAFDRLAEDTINGSGLVAGAHNVVANDMWEVQGEIGPANGHDTPPWHITYDLEENVTLDSIHVWNFNEAGSLATAGAKDVEILVSSTDNVGDLVSLGNFVFDIAPGAAGYLGFDVDLSGVPSSALDDVRLVRFNILTNHGQGASLVGLSEVQFFKSTANPIPEPATATLAMLGLGGLVMRRRRNAA